MFCVRCTEITSTWQNCPRAVFAICSLPFIVRHSIRFCGIVRQKITTSIICSVGVPKDVRTKKCIWLMPRIGQGSGVVSRPWSENPSCHQTFRENTSSHSDLNISVTVTRQANAKVRLTLNFFVLTSKVLPSLLVPFG